MSFKAAVVVCHLVIPPDMDLVTNPPDPESLKCISLIGAEHREYGICMLEAMGMKMRMIQRLHHQSTLVTLLGGCEDIGEGT